MPSAEVARSGSWEKLDTDALVARLNLVASVLQVTSSALRWRLVALGELPAKRAREIPEALLRNNGRMEVKSAPPPLFSKQFAEVLKLALEQGRVSARRAAALVDVSADDLPELLAAHGVDYEVEP